MGADPQAGDRRSTPIARSTRPGALARSGLPNGLQYIHSRFVRESRRGTLLAAVLSALTIILIWYWPKLPVHPLNSGSSQSLYMLSAEAQSLAAVFGLVLTISLVVAQLASRHSPRVLGDYFDRLTITYLIGLLLAVLLPLWALSQPDAILVRLAATSTATSLYWLIPYFLRFRNRVDPEHELVRLADVIIGLLDKSFSPRGDPARQTQFAVAMATQDRMTEYLTTSFGLKEYATFGTCVRQMARIVAHTFAAHAPDGISSAGHPLCDLVRKGILAQLGDAAIRTIDDPWAPNEIVGAMNSISRQTADERVAVWGRLLDTLAAIGRLAVERGLDDMAKEVVSGVDAIGQKGRSDPRWGLVGRALYYLRDLGESAAGRRLLTTALRAVLQINDLAKASDDASLVAVRCLGRIGAAAIKSHMAAVTRNSASSLETIARHAPGPHDWQPTATENAINAVRTLAELGQLAVSEERAVDAGVVVRYLYNIGRLAGAPKDDLVKGLIVIRDPAVGSKASMTPEDARAVPEELIKRNPKLDLSSVENFAEAARKFLCTPTAAV